MRLSRFTALPLAVFGGFMLDLASPSANLWPLAFPAVAFVLAAVWQQSAKAGALLGAVAGAAFWMPHISWLTTYLGPVPWLALSVFMTAWFSVMGAAIAFTTGALTRLPWLQHRPALHPLVLSVAVTAIWVTREQIQTSWPYGGFSWGRVVFTQSESPFAESVSWIGLAGLSAVMVFTMSLIVATLGKARPGATRSAPEDHSANTRFAALATALVVLILSALAPAAVTGTEADRTLRVAGIQGNAKAGIFDDRESGDVIRSHINATRDYLAAVQSGHAQGADVLVWPENSAEFDVRENLTNYREVASLARQAQAPIVIGSILRDTATTFDTGSGEATDHDLFFNSALVMTPDGTLTERYDKINPVPFGEYMPHRAFYRALAPDLVDLVQLDYQPGTKSSVVDISGNATGLAVCFDITFDRHTTEMIGDNAEIVYALTNNADFGQTDESVQQLAITRLQAIAMGRSLVNVSTVGTSEILAPDGSTLAAIESFVPGAVVAEVPIVSATTPAMRFGHIVTAALIAAAVLALGAAITVTATGAGSAAKRDALRAAR